MGLRSKKKEVDQPKSEDTDTTVVSVGSASKLDSVKRMLPKSRKTTGLLVGIIILIFLLVGFALLRSKDNNSPDRTNALTLSGFGKEYNITQEDYRKLIDQAREQEIDPTSAKETIIKSYKYKIVAKELKIEPSTDQITASARASGNYRDEIPLNDWQQLSVYVPAVDGNKILASTGGYVGSFFDYPVNFSNADKADLNQKKQDAAKLASEHRQQLIDGKINASSIIDKTRNDRRLTSDGFGSTSEQLRITKSGSIPVLGEGYTITIPTYVLAAVSSLGDKPGVSDVREVEGMGYFFVSISDVISANQNIDNNFRNMLSDVRVVDNVK